MCFSVHYMGQANSTDFYRRRPANPALTCAAQDVGIEPIYSFAAMSDVIHFDMRLNAATYTGILCCVATVGDD